jgi:23S rRNA pseudouridine2605 synthase
MAEAIRLQKFLSQAGVASRRAAEELILDGRVRINGQVARELGVKVDPAADRVEVDGRRVRAAAPVWIALHKPEGYVTTRSDPEGRPTIYDLLPKHFSGLFHVGRLDAGSEGLLLLTNQGELANRMLHPRYAVERVYDAVVLGRLSDAELRQLREGVELEDGLARAAAVERRSVPAPGVERVRVTMLEGRKREVRRLFKAIGHPVRRLVRRSYGPIELKGLRPGQWRRLTAEEVAAMEKGEKRREK